MRIIVLIVILITYISFSNCSNDKKLNDGQQYVFKDFNEIHTFFKRNDTLFCETSNGILHYNKIHDEWLIDSIYHNFNKTEPRQTLNNRSDFPNGYQVSAYTSYDKQHGSWFLITHADEGAYGYKQEIIDTSENKIYKFPYEGINDFIVDNGIIWVGSYFGISKIEIKSLRRTDYYLLPSFKKITAINITSNDVYYLDFHYGLFKYEKESKEIIPISNVNAFANDSNYKFSNFFLHDSIFYILCNPMERFGNFLQGKARLIVYNLKTKNLENVITGSSFFDSFLMINNSLVCFGERCQVYEGGVIEYFGGVVAYNLNDGQLIDLINLPIVSLTEKNNSLEALSIQNYDCFLTYEKVKLSKDFSFPIKMDIIEKDTFYQCFDAKYNDGDSAFFDDPYYGKRKVTVGKKQFDDYSNMYSKLKRQHPIISDSILCEYPVNYINIKIPNKRIEEDKY